MYLGDGVPFVGDLCILEDSAAGLIDYQRPYWCGASDNYID